MSETLDQLKVLDASEIKGCAHERCELDREALVECLIERHGTELRTRLYASHFDQDHDPRRPGRRDVSRIHDKIERAKEREKTKPTCSNGCHPFKTWENFEFRSFYGDAVRGRVTRQSVTEYKKLKLQRFNGEDPHPDHNGRCGCQGYVDKNGTEHECPFREYLEKMKLHFESTRRLGVSSNIDSEYGFLVMYALDHTNPNEKNENVSAMASLCSEAGVRRLINEWNLGKLRCVGCHRFKSILCGDFVTVFRLHPNASVLTNQVSDESDTTLEITIEDEANQIL
jgi:hypothetical protein